MINVENNYDKSDKKVGFSDDSDDDQQELIDCILIVFLSEVFWSVNQIYYTYHFEMTSDNFESIELKVLQ